MKKKARILIIDDEPDFVDDLKAVLEAEDWEVSTAANSERARSVLPGVKPDVVVLGTIVPRGDAFLLHQWLKSDLAFRGVPIIVLDAPQDKRSVKGWLMQEGLQLQSEDYLSKPIECASLVPRVAQLLRGAVAKGIKVLVVDDHAVVREGICALLSLQKDIEVVGEAVDGQDAIEKVRQYAPDVVLMDIVMPVMSGLEATKQICRDYAETKVLILTQYDYDENMFVAKQVGANGFIAKRSASSDLMSAIRAVGDGRYYPPSFAYVLANWPEGAQPEKTAP